MHFWAGELEVYVFLKWGEEEKKRKSKIKMKKMTTKNQEKQGKERDLWVFWKGFLKKFHWRTVNKVKILNMFSKNFETFIFYFLMLYFFNLLQWESQLNNKFVFQKSFCAVPKKNFFLISKKFSSTFLCDSSNMSFISIRKNFFHKILLKKWG